MPDVAINYSYAAVPTIREFTLSDARIKALMGPFGSGKSSGCVIHLLRAALNQEPDADGIKRRRSVIVRNTYKQLEDTTIKTFEQWIPFESFGTYLKTQHTFRCTAFPGLEWEVLFRALDRPDHVKNLLSLECSDAWFNEAREVPWSIIEAMGGRIERFPKYEAGVSPGATNACVIMDTNPPDDDSKFYKFFEESKYPGTAIFKQPSGLADNAENLTAHKQGRGYYTNMMIGKDENFIKVYIKGEYGYVQEGKPVYPEYSDSMHCAAIDPVPGFPIYRGWDFGLSPACIFAQSLGQGRVPVLDELCGDNMGADRFSDDVVTFSGERFPGFSFVDVGDPAGDARSQSDERTCFEILQKKGIKIEPGNQDPYVRQESVKKALNTLREGKPLFQLSPRCKKLRKGFLGKYQYRRLQTAGDKFSDKPDKNEWSHPHDALQYICARLFGDGLKREERKPEPVPEFISWGAATQAGMGWMV